VLRIERLGSKLGLFLARFVLNLNGTPKFTQRHSLRPFIAKETQAGA
jgi:hypothetical protein